MKKAIIAITLLVVAGYAAASCPVMTRYQCVPAGNGKMACGCY
jgi:hypothetical protein